MPDDLDAWVGNQFTKEREAIRLQYMVVVGGGVGGGGGGGVGGGGLRPVFNTTQHFLQDHA